MESIMQLYAISKTRLKKVCISAPLAVFLVCSGLLIASPAQATPKLCIPQAQGVPYLAGYPNWWTQSADPNLNRLAFSFDDDDSRRTDDPRWAGALDIGHNMGATDDAEVRALYATMGTEKSLLLSWSAKSLDQFNNGFTSVIVGLKSPAGDPLVLRIQINQSSTQSGADVLPRYANEGGVSYLGFSMLRRQGGNWTSVQTIPAWVSDKTRVWIMPATTNSKIAFTVQMVVPLGPSGLNLPAGSNLQMWYSIQPSVPLGADDPGLQSFSWPKGNPVIFAYYDTLNGVPHIPDPTEWGEFALDFQAGCAGVTLKGNDIGVMNTEFPGSRQQISLNVPNTFYALPTNSSGSSLNMSDIKATFHFANWGSQRGDLTDQSWRQLSPNLSEVAVINNPANPAESPLASNAAAVPANVKVQASNNWSLNQTEKCRFFIEGQPSQHLAAGCPAAPAPDINPHGCILVKLTSKKVEFLNDSVVRNMDFVKHSKSVLNAEIHLPAATKRTSVKKRSRDIYMSVERRNMSATASQTTTLRKSPFLEAVTRIAPRTAPTTALAFKSKGVRLNEIVPILAAGKLPLMPIEKLAAVMPTWAAHVFNDTGNYGYINGKRHKLLEQQTSFGYYAWHAGDIQGWTDKIEGAKNISPDLYKISVPLAAPARIKVITEAIEKPVILNPGTLNPGTLNPGTLNPGTLNPGRVIKPVSPINRLPESQLVH